MLQDRIEGKLYSLAPSVIAKVGTETCTPNMLFQLTSRLLVRVGAVTLLARSSANLNKLSCVLSSGRNELCIHYNRHSPWQLSLVRGITCSHQF